MFDDSKRLDKLESQMAEIAKAKTDDRLNEMIKAHNESVKNLGDWIKQLEKTVTDNAVLMVKSNNEFRKQIGDLQGEVKKLQQRCANVEAAVKKLGK
jgi:uncharacterized protein YlxW (UPF0749 family)